MQHATGPVETYLQSFHWNKVKYRADKPIAELIDSLQKDLSAIDNDVKQKFNQYNSTKTNLTSLQKSQTGNLSQKSLNTVVNPDTLIKPDDSEYLQQHLLAIPATLARDFLKSYEQISPMVVPRSAQLLAKDDEFQLYAVTVFKKHSAEFVHKCREQRWTPREMKFADGGREAEEQELRRLEKEERRVWGEALRLGRTGYSDAVMGWIHVLTLRVFVETVLRYGLPLSYVCGLVKVRVLPFNPLSPHDDGFADNLPRPTPNAPKRPKPPWTAASPTWEATPWPGTTRAGSSRTTRACSRNWLASATRTTSRMFSTSLRLYDRACSGVHFPRVRTISSPGVRRRSGRYCKGG